MFAKAKVIEDSTDSAKAEVQSQTVWHRSQCGTCTSGAAGQVFQTRGIATLVLWNGSGPSTISSI